MLVREYVLFCIGEESNMIVSEEFYNYSVYPRVEYTE